MSDFMKRWLFNISGLMTNYKTSTLLTYIFSEVARQQVKHHRLQRDRQSRLYLQEWLHWQYILEDEFCICKRT